MTSATVAIIGAGRVGGSIGFLLARAGYTVSAVANRSLASSQRATAFIGAGSATTDVVAAASGADIILITTPDGVIRDVCRIISRGGALKKDALVVHTSGAHTIDLLDSAKEAGGCRAVLHPLQSLPSREQGIGNIAGSYFRIEADPGGRERAETLVKALGGVELKMTRWEAGPQSAALYHAGAVSVSNYFVALVGYGLQFYEALGADRREALKAVLPLIQGTLRNIEALGIPGALTGPISRGDVDTVRGHLDAMREKNPELLDLYKALARQTIQTAREQDGITNDTAEEFLALLKHQDPGRPLQ